MSSPESLIQEYAVGAVISIYALRDPRTRQIRYVGKAQNPARRLQMHVSAFQLSYYQSRKNCWLKGLLAEGHSPQLEILDVVPAAEANAAEIRWIARCRADGAPLTNGTDGGDGGAITDPDAKARVRAAHLGKKLSDKTKAKMSASALRRCADEQERERLRSIGNGKPPVHHGEKNPRTKLSDVQVRQIREHAAAGEDLGALAVEFGITAASVTQLVTGKFRVAAGGPIREAKSRSILTDGDVAEIRRLAVDGVPNVELARRYGVHPSHISKTLSGQRRRLSNQ